MSDIVAAAELLPSRRHDGWTVPRQTKFLEVLAETASVTAAARVVGKSTQSAYRRRKKSPVFAEAWEAALARATIDLEAVAFERAVYGVEKPVFHGGKQCGAIRGYSDALLMFLLKARRPDRYGRMEGVREKAAAPAMPDMEARRTAADAALDRLRAAIEATEGEEEA